MSQTRTKPVVKPEARAALETAMAILKAAHIAEYRSEKKWCKRIGFKVGVVGQTVSMWNQGSLFPKDARFNAVIALSKLANPFARGPVH